MRKETTPTPHFTEKLTTAVRIDFPAAQNVLVSYPEKWEVIHTFPRSEFNLYAAGFEPSQERPDPNHFHGLSPEINRTLKNYRQYRLFEPWPQPVIPIKLNDSIHQPEEPLPGQIIGQVMSGGHLDVRLQPIAEAQAWTGGIFGVLWECYAFELRRQDNWRDELANFWQAVEADMRVAKIFTHSFDPAFAEGYTDFLSELGYRQDPDFLQWWSKEIAG